MLSFTACVCIGMVMISMMISTSITSMSGVVLMSTITSASRAPPPSDMAMLRFSCQPPRGGGSVMKPILRMPARWQLYTTRPTNS